MTSLIRGVEKKRVENWARTYSCAPALYFEPSDAEQVREILRMAQENKRKVRCIGCSHSPSTLAFTDDYLISIRKFDKILDIDIKKYQVKVEGGVMIDRLNKILQDNKMAFSVLGAISSQTVAGAVSIGFHGSGVNYGVLSSYVIEIEIMDALGNVRTLTKAEGEVNDEFHASVVGLGCLGVILSVRFQCEESFNLEQIVFPGKLEHVLASLQTHLNNSEHFRMFWYPHTEDVMCYSVSRTKKAADPKPSLIRRAQNWFKNIFIGYYVLEFLLWLSTFVHALVPLINGWHFKLFCKQSKSVGSSYDVFNFDCLFKQYVYESAIPIKETAHYLLNLKAWLENNKHVKAHFAVEIRFVKGDDLWLSPCHQQDSCYLNIIMFKPYGRDFERAAYWDFNEKLMVECNGRPHWAKTHSMTKEYFSKVYTKFNHFNELRQRRDPHNRFINKCLEPIFL